MGLFRVSPPVDPENPASPKAKMPPSEATSQYCFLAPGGTFAAESLLGPEVPVIDEFTESVAVMVWLPAVWKVAWELKVWTPLSRPTKV